MKQTYNSNILITNVDNDGDDVLIMAEAPLSALEVGLALTARGISFTEIYYIKPSERQYYIFDPFWASPAIVENIRRKAAAFTAEKKGTAIYRECVAKCAH